MWRVPDRCTRYTGACSASSIRRYDVSGSFKHTGILGLLLDRYVGALPVALGVRSTNVYEDRSIALFEEEIDDDEPEPTVFYRPGMTRAKVWGEYTVRTLTCVCV